MCVHSRGRRAARRAAGRSIAATLIALAAAAGCQTVKTQPTGLGLGPGSPGDPARPNGPKTDFRSKVGPEQEFNVHLELARAHESMGNSEAALGEYQKAVEVCQKKGTIFGGSKIGPTQQALAQRRMAAALDRMGRFAQAESHYLNAMKVAPNDPQVWNDVGYSYYVQGRLADAERALKTASALDPNNQRVLTNLGLTYTAMGRTPDALAAFSRAGGPAIGNHNLAYALAANNQTDQARHHYEAALAHQPQLTLARQALAQLDARRTAAPPSAALASASTPPTGPVVRPDQPLTALVPPAVAVGVSDPKLSLTSATTYRSTAAPGGATPGASAAAPAADLTARPGAPAVPGR